MKYFIAFLLVIGYGVDSTVYPTNRTDGTFVAITELNVVTVKTISDLAMTKALIKLLSVEKANKIVPDTLNRTCILNTSRILLGEEFQWLYLIRRGAPDSYFPNQVQQLSRAPPETLMASEFFIYL